MWQTLAHSKVYTLSPPELPTWINPPADLTVSCLNAPDPNNLPTLSFVNGIEWSRLCYKWKCPINKNRRFGGLQEFMYKPTYTDQCMRDDCPHKKYHNSPPPAATFINPPADITVFMS
ncbi:MAG: hypothetical protein IPJ39_19720 [Saprospiraceae bacterium]|nr:hypothetical protein [Saprospiraceae bacterium]